MFPSTDFQRKTTRISPTSATRRRTFFEKPFRFFFETKTILFRLNVWIRDGVHFYRIRTTNKTLNRTSVACLLFSVVYLIIGLGPLTYRTRYNFLITNIERIIRRSSEISESVIITANRTDNVYTISTKYLNPPSVIHWTDRDKFYVDRSGNPNVVYVTSRRLRTRPSRRHIDVHKSPR